MTTTVYGIRNCDTMKKARAWLDANNIAYRFHDYRTDGLERAQLVAWCDALGLDAVLNRAGTTFRKLPDSDKAELSRDRAIDLMLAQPALIKRPMLDRDGAFVVGFRPDHYQALF
jgi:Spx/MgsR family transcriptional regulator